MSTRHDAWAQTKLEPYIWWCGDEVCDCTQPRIDRITPNMNAGYPWINRENLWSGTFHSEAELDERAEQKAQLRDACVRFNIEPPLEVLDG